MKKIYWYSCLKAVLIFFFKPRVVNYFSRLQHWKSKKFLQEVSSSRNLTFWNIGIKIFKRYLPSHYFFIFYFLILGSLIAIFFSHMKKWLPRHQARICIFPNHSAGTPYHSLDTFLNLNHLQLLWVLKFSLLEKERTALPFPAALIFTPFTEQFHWLHRSLSGFTPVQKWGKKTWPLVWNIRFINAFCISKNLPFYKGEQLLL